MRYLFAIAGLLVGTSVTADSETLEIRLKASAELPSGKPVTIADVAEIAGPESMACRAARVVLTAAPQPGGARRIALSYVAGKVRAAGLNASHVTGADAVIVAGSCSRLGAQDLCEEAKTYLLSLLPTDGRTYELTVQRTPREIVAPSGEVSVRPRLVGSAARLGANSIALDAMLDGKIVATTSAVIDVRAVAEVLVAAESIPQGTPVTDANTVTQPRDISRTPTAITGLRSDSAGRFVARRTIGAGSVITTADIEPPLVVRRGDRVDVLLTCGGITLRTTAEVRQDGRPGEIVQVRPAVSQADIRARVIGPNTVSVLR